MSNKKTKTIFSILLLFFILSTNAYASTLTDSLTKINDFFASQQYARYSTFIDFFLFFTIALAAMLIGIKAVFPEQMRQGNIIAIIIALITTISLVRAGVSVEKLIEYAGIIVFIGLVLIIYFFMHAIGMLRERKFLAFLTALIIAFILFILLGWGEYYGYVLS